MTSCCPEKKDAGASSCTCQKTPAGSKPTFSPNTSTGPSCCNDQIARSGASLEKPGYRLWGFVKDFLPSAAGPVPQVHTQLNREDRLGTLGARLGVRRDDYRIAPGLYGIGSPDNRSPVLVTANYKLSFDVLRTQLADVDAWILAVDTRGINVWCAAGKGSFCAQEVAKRVQSNGLDDIVEHRRLILPQLSATGVSGRRVKKLCGFEVVWGPVHAGHIKEFLDNQMKTTPDMRRVTFTLQERVALIPVELSHMGKPTLYLVLALFLLSGFGQGIFSFSTAVTRGATALAAYILAVLAGAVLTPVLLPWLPGRAFAVKGVVSGAVAGILLTVLFSGRLILLEVPALTLFVMSVSSYLAMNFTGSTPYTSPTGVEKEMRKAIPAQTAGILVAALLWIGAGFMGS